MGAYFTVLRDYCNSQSSSQQVMVFPKMVKGNKTSNTWQPLTIIPKPLLCSQEN